MALADTWRGAALSSTDGIGRFQEGVQFTMPVNQNGNEANKLFTSVDGATALAFTNQSGKYYITPQGMCTYMFVVWTSTANGADGTIMRAYMPYTNNGPAAYGPSRKGTTAAASALCVAHLDTATAFTYCNILAIQVLDNSFTAGGTANDFLNFRMDYYPFG